MDSCKFLLGRAVFLIVIFSGCVCFARADVATDLGFKAGDTVKPTCGKIQETQLDSVLGVCLGISEALLQRSPIFSYTEAGHFGDKTQYDTKAPDEFGNIYTAHCRRGICYGIEVKSSRPLSLVAASAICRQLVQSVTGKVISVDIDDFKYKDAGVNCIYVYFTDCHAEIIFQKDLPVDVAQIRVWLDK